MEDGFHKLVEEWWCTSTFEGWSGFVLLQKRKGLKNHIKDWRKGRGVWGSEKIRQLEDNLHEVQRRMEGERVSDFLRTDRLTILNQLWKEYRAEESQWLQKSRVKWIRDSDRITSF